jgi:hypothetical protein
MLKDERRYLSSTRGHVQGNYAESREAHEDESIGLDPVENFLGCPELVPVVARLIRVCALLFRFAQVKEVVEVEFMIELLEWSNPAASIVPPAQKDSQASFG